MRADTFLSVLTLVACFSPLAVAAPSSSRVAMTKKRRIELVNETKKMWSHGFDNYMTFAYPADEIKPITCKGQGRDSNSYNYARNDVNPNAALTHLDSLSTIPIFKSESEFIRHIDLVLQPGRTNWDQDIKIQVFEITIRVLGSLLSTYQQLEVIERRKWEAKHRSREVATWTMPTGTAEGEAGRLRLGNMARSGPKQLWMGWVSSLKHLAGIVEADDRSNLTSSRKDSGTCDLSTDMGEPDSGSSPPGEPVDRIPGKKKSPIPAFQPSKRSIALLGLALDLGERLLPAFDTPTGIPYSRVNLRFGIDKSTETPETCAAAAGSLVLEFTLLSRLTGDDRFESVARKAFFAVWERRSALGLIGNSIEVNNGNWLLGTSTIGAGVDSFFEYALKGAIILDDPDFMNIFEDAYRAVMTYMRSPSGHMYRTINMHHGMVAGTLTDSLSAFWPGLQVSAGDLQGAIESHLIYWQIWRKYSAMPEAFNILNKTSEWHGYPLRPEFVESTYHLYQATKDEFYLRVGERVLKDLRRRTWSRCGFAVLHDVHSGKREDRMESFMLSETLKYLYLLFEEAHPINRRDSNTVFTTEGHLLSVPRRLGLPSIAYRRGSLHDEYRGSSAQCRPYQPAERGGLRTGIEGRVDYDFTAFLVDMPLLKDDGYWDRSGWCAVTVAAQYSFGISFSIPPVEGGASVSVVPTAGAFSRIGGNIEITNTTGVRGRVALNDDALGYRVISVGDLRVHDGQRVVITDPAASLDEATGFHPRSPSHSSEQASWRPRQSPQKYVVTESVYSIDADGRLTDVVVKILSGNRIIGEGIGTTATFGLKLLPDHAHGDVEQLPEAISTSPFGLSKPPVRLLRPGMDAHGCPGSVYLPPSEDNPGTPWIAFVQRGSCTFLEKLSTAEASGAAGAIVWGLDDLETDNDLSDLPGRETTWEKPSIRPSVDPCADDVAQVNDVGMVYLGSWMGKGVDEWFDSFETLEQGSSAAELHVILDPLEMSPDGSKVATVDGQHDAEGLFPWENDLHGTCGGSEIGEGRERLAAAAGGTGLDLHEADSLDQEQSSDQMRNAINSMLDKVTRMGMRAHEASLGELSPDPPTQPDGAHRTRRKAQVAGLPVVNMDFSIGGA